MRHTGGLDDEVLYPLAMALEPGLYLYRIHARPRPRGRIGGSAEETPGRFLGNGMNLQRFPPGTHQMCTCWATDFTDRTFIRDKMAFDLNTSMLLPQGMFVKTILPGPEGRRTSPHPPGLLLAGAAGLPIVGAPTRFGTGIPLLPGAPTSSGISENYSLHLPCRKKIERTRGLSTPC